MLNDNRPTEQGQGTASVAMECKKPTAGIVLAAGMSTRFGRPKQLLNLRGKTVLERTLDACLDSKLERIYLVLGYKHQDIIDAIFDKIDHQDMKIIINRDFQNGQSTSLRAGILEIRDTFSSAMFILGDQPFIDSSTLNVLLERYWASDKNIGVPFFQLTLLGGTFLFLATFNAALYAIFAGRLGEYMEKRNVRKWFNRCGGSTLIGAGIFTAGMQRTS